MWNYCYSPFGRVCNYLQSKIKSTFAIDAHSLGLDRLYWLSYNFTLGYVSRNPQCTQLEFTDSNLDFPGFVNLVAYAQ